RANEMPQPWFMWLAYNAAHKPLHVPPAHLHNQLEPAGNAVLMYAAMVEALDTEIGRLLASIEPARLANTTIIFLGDNGHVRSVVPPPYDKYPGKGTVYEGGINVPFIVTGPVVPRSSRGRTSSALVNTTDVYRTVADIAGVDLADVFPPRYKVDSVSLLPLLADPDRTPAARRYAYAERFRPNGAGPYELRQRAIRDGRWKLIRRLVPNSDPPFKDQLFDLDNAPPALDGDDRCPCPENLSGEALAAYERLSNALVDLSGP
ncbi:MAG: sulfatase-like hydrolase/transferase, partial [Planctomycetes bacterium]|nr:sulfatase-like hydrolase/transferase [Planctomycetota bacterium]